MDGIKLIKYVIAGMKAVWSSFASTLWGFVAIVVFDISLRTYSDKFNYLLDNYSINPQPLLNIIGLIFLLLFAFDFYINIKEINKYDRPTW